MTTPTGFITTSTDNYIFAISLKYVHLIILKKYQVLSEFLAETDMSKFLLNIQTWNLLIISFLVNAL